MSEINKVVVRYLDGRVVKGTTEDFFPNRPLFHLQPLGAQEKADVRCKELKAVFFVRDFAGDPKRTDAAGFDRATPDINKGKKIAVRFKDGEVLCGFTLTYMPDREGYFVTPADPGNNNLRVYVLTHAVREVRVGPAADALAGAAARPRAA
jgi:hypothetical protein